jgi:hypothetical protein
LWWQAQLQAKRAEAPQLAGFLKKLADTLREVEHYGQGNEPLLTPRSLPLAIAAVPWAPRTMTIGSCSIHAARWLLKHYAFTPLEERAFDPAADNQRIAALIEMYLGRTDALRALPLAESYLSRLKNGDATEKEVRKAFFDLVGCLAVLPKYMRTQEEMMHVTSDT